MFEGVITGILLIVVGAVRVVPQLLVGGRWGAEASLAAVAVGLGLLILGGELREYLGRRMPPHARSLRRD